MNIYDFFNSPDVAEHCRRIGHTLNAVESAVMIDQCDSRTLAEKHAAYRIIIAEYPDMEIPTSNNHGYIKSFHKALGDIIAYEKQICEKLLLSEPDAIYRAGIEDYDLGGYYSNYETALACAMEFVKGEEEAREHFCKDRESKPLVHIENHLAYLLTEEETSKTAPDESNDREKFSISCITLHKVYIDSGKYVNARLSRSGEIMSVQQEGLIPKDSDGDLDLLDSCYIDIPVPFKRGDLVEVGNYGHLFGRSSAPYGGVYVLKDICRDNPERNAERILRSDLMDMTANVYYEEAGCAECECIHFYPDLRYCRRKLDGETRILKYISLYMQDKLCLCSLLKIQKYLSSDKQISDLRNSPNLQWDLSQIEDDLLI